MAKKIFNLYQIMIIIFIGTGAFFSPLTTAAESDPPAPDETPAAIINYTPSLWQKTRQEKEHPVKKKEKKPWLDWFKKQATAAPKPGKLAIELPMESLLNISGNKSITGKYNGKYKFKKKEGERSHWTFNPDMEQGLRVGIRGTVKEKTSVDVNWNDQLPNMKDIRIHYKGKPGETIQEAAFGDVNLSLPHTKFVGFSKRVFGVKTAGQYKNLKFTAIGSKTKGATKTQRFEGYTSLQKKFIPDRQYLKRKYYQVASPEEIVSGTEKIWVDDRNSATNTQTTRDDLIPGYSFDEKSPHDDYTIDYKHGIMVCRMSIQPNYVIAADYKTPSGKYKSESQDNKPIIIKPADEEGNGLKNHYSLGGRKILRKGFILRVEDYAGHVIQNLIINEQDVSSGDYKLAEIDYDAGSFKFAKLQPFTTDVYQTINPQTHHRIYAEYYSQRKEYMLGFGLVKYSEHISLDGKELKRDEDYVIDYEYGMLIFNRPEEIKPDSIIDATYEQAGFGAALQETLLGTRLEYNPAKNFFLGGTCIYSGSPRPLSIPNLGSQLPTKLVLDLDTRYSFAPKKLPFRMDFSGEVAHSVFNPNSFGKVMIDNMEGCKETSTMPMLKKDWRPASPPAGCEQITRAKIAWRDEEINASEIRPADNTISEGERQRVLKIEYTADKDHDWLSLVHPISTAGQDYSQKEFLEIWVKGESGKNPQLSIDLGKIAEDSDGDGILDTEDKNGDYLLNEGEDIGWDFNYPGPDEKVGTADDEILLVGLTAEGEGNGYLDSEDLDRNGFLDGEGIIHTRDRDTEDKLISIDSTIWQRITIPLNITNPEDWDAIKHIRLSLTDLKGEGTIWIAGVSIVGNRWEKGELLSSSTDYAGSFEVAARNNSDDTGYYEPLCDSDEFGNYYNSLYQTASTSERSRRKEQSLSIKYDLPAGTTGFTYHQYYKPQDFSDYATLKFFFYIKKSSDSLPDLFIDLHTTDDSYFRVLSPLKNKEEGKWHTGEISQNDFLVIGTPSINKVNKIKIGLINSTDSQTAGEIWVNELHLTDVKERGEIALSERMFEPDTWRYGANINTSLGKWLSLKGNIDYQGPKFQTIGAQYTNQESFRYGLGSNINPIKFLPISVNWSKAEKTAYQTEKTLLLSSKESGYSRSENFSGSTSLKLPSFLPQISGSGKWGRTFTKQLAGGTTQQNIGYGGSVKYNVPYIKFIGWALPRNLSTTYNRTESHFLYNSTSTSYYNHKDFTDRYSGGTSFRLGKFSFNPTYSLQQAFTRRENERQKIKSQNQAIGFNSTLRIFRWLTPSFNGKMSCNENYNIRTGTDTLTKSASRENSLKTSLSLTASSILPKFKPTKSIRMSLNGQISQGDTYATIPKGIPIKKYLWIGDDVWLLQTKDKKYFHLDPHTDKLDNPKSKKDRWSVNANGQWNPFDFWQLKGIFSFVPTISTRARYNLSSEISGNLGSKTSSRSQTWPHLQLTVSKLDKLPLLRLFLKATSLTVNLSNKISEKFNLLTNERFSRTQNLNGSVSLHFKIKDKSFSPSFRHTQKITNTRGAITTSLSQSGGINYSTDIGAHWKIPFTKWEFKKPVHLSSGLSGSYKKNTSGEKIQKNSLSSKWNLSLQYFLSSNFNFNFSLNVNYLHDILVPSNDYIGFGGGLGANIRF